MLSSILHTVRENFSPAHALLLVFTLAYTVAAGMYFSSIGNSEFLGYLVVVVLLVFLGAAVFTHQRVPLWLLALLSLLGLIHLLGAAVMVNGDILYNYVPFPIENPTGLTFIKFDQIVHTYGSIVAALLMYYFLARDTTFHWLGIASLTVLGAMGLGALNEVMEFIAKMTVPDTDVGGYYNTALDLCMNLFGAVLGTLGAFLFWKEVEA